VRSEAGLLGGQGQLPTAWSGQGQVLVGQAGDGRAKSRWLLASRAEALFSLFVLHLPPSPPSFSRLCSGPSKD
jgi:hypothetical protein